MRVCYPPLVDHRSHQSFEHFRADATSLARSIQPVVVSQTPATEEAIATSPTAHGGLLRCQRLTLRLLSSWGDPHFIGLSGLLPLGPDGKPLALRPEQLSATPRDLASTAGYPVSVCLPRVMILLCAQQCLFDSA